MRIRTSRLPFLGLVFLSAIASLGILPAVGQDKVVHVYNWSDYIDTSIIDQFEQETGIKVLYDVFDSNSVLETKLLAGESGYDVVVPSSSFLERQAQAGVFQPLDKSRLHNLGNLWDVIQQRTDSFDHGGKYSVNYMWGTTGIGYNTDAVKARLGIDAIDSWEVIFDPDKLAKLSDCGVHVLVTPGGVLPAAMNSLGLDPKSQEPADFEQAADLMVKIRPYITKFHSSAYIDALASGDACLVIGWSGDVLQARDRADDAGSGVHVEYVIPKEGAQMWFDQMAIPRDAPNPEAAHLFVDFMMRPDTIAAASNYVHYANGNKASQALLDSDVVDDPGIYPPPAVMAKLYVTPTYEQDILRLNNRLWTRIKSGE